MVPLDGGGARARDGVLCLGGVRFGRRWSRSRHAHLVTLARPLALLDAVLMALSHRVDEHAVSYAEVMVKMRIFEGAADHIADLVKNTGTQADVRDV